MKHRRLLGALLIALSLITACATSAPSAEGVQAYLRQDYEQAVAQLDPLAQKGDATAQYYVALMTLEGRPAATTAIATPGQALTLLAASASAGDNKALATLIVLSLAPPEREALADAFNTEPAAPLMEGVIPGATVPLSAITVLQPRARTLAEAAAGGPLPFAMTIALASALKTVETWPAENQTLGSGAFSLYKIDKARAERNDKYAAARLGNRYKDGVGVAQDPAEAFRWHRKAARTSGPPRNCVYQAPVGDTSGSVMCFDAGPTVSGVPKAMLEVCRAYADGVGVDRNPARAKRWCNRAAKNAQWRQEAEAILASLPS